MSAPSDFQLSPAPEGLHLPPSLPKRLKPEIYQNLDVFKRVDEHAITVSFTQCLVANFDEHNLVSFFVCLGAVYLTKLFC